MCFLGKRACRQKGGQEGFSWGTPFNGGFLCNAYRLYLYYLKGGKIARELLRKWGCLVGDSPGFGCLTDCKIPEMVYYISVFPYQCYHILRSISVVIFAKVRQLYEMDIVFNRIERNDRPLFEVLTFVAI